MRFETTDREDGVLLRIEGELNIYEAGAVRDALIEAFDRGVSMDLELNSVSSCDAAGLQLLCAARKTAFEENLAFRVTGASDAVLEVTRQAGMAAEVVLGPEWGGTGEGRTDTGSR